MPHYRFHLTDGRRRIDDSEGLELAGDAAAREEALRVGRLLVKRHGEPARDGSRWFVAITDAHGREIDRVPLAIIE